MSRNGIKGIHHISMKCDNMEDFEKTKSFYCGILGMEARREWDTGIMIDTGSGLLEIFHNGKGFQRTGALRHFALCCEDVDQIVEKIKAAGYDVFEGPKDICIPSSPPLYARIAFCTGPLKEEIELFQENK